MDHIVVVDISTDLNACKALADSLCKYGCVIVKSPNVDEILNDDFISTMQSYFSLPLATKLQDSRPELGYQVGVTPENVEVSRCVSDPAFCEDYINKLNANDKPLIAHKADLKWRYFWRIGSRPTSTEFPELNASKVIPQSIPHFEESMDKWGTLLHEAVNQVATMLAIGLNLPSNTFTDLAHNGPHLLAPTATDLSVYSEKNSIYAGFHYDLNMLTIHGRSNFPGLQIWTREGRKMDVSIPSGCLLVQAGIQIQMLTSGFIHAGYHQVVCTDKTADAIEKAKKENKNLWRISSTLFYHVASDNRLVPVLDFNGNPITQDPSNNCQYLKAGEQVELELKAIKLKE